MSSADRPCLVGVQFVPFQHEGRNYIQIKSREGLSDHWLPIARENAAILQFFNGEHTLEQMRLELQRRQGLLVSHAALTHLVEQLDSIFVLDTSRYHSRKREIVEAFQTDSVREPSHAGGAYQGDPTQLREQIRQLFEHPNGPGLPNGNRSTRELRGILSPHIDFYRGGASFAWGFKRLAEETDATVFVIIGTSHYSAECFILTRKDFKTPLGTARNNRAFVDHVARLYGPEVYKDELAHKPEHSIEFQVLFLQYLFDGKRDFTIVPLLVGSFYDFVEYRQDPHRCRRCVANGRRSQASGAGVRREGLLYLVGRSGSHRYEVRRPLDDRSSSEPVVSKRR